MANGQFEWDPAKADAHVRKHGIDFNAARRVFSDQFVVIEYDESSSDHEDRFVAIGLLNGRLITVFYTERGDRIRIISARKANSYEQRKYHRGTGPP